MNFLSKLFPKELKLRMRPHHNGSCMISSVKGDWIDLVITESKTYKAGDTVTVDFGMSVELPKGYEAHILPRSSTFENTGLLLTNSMGIIDNSYCGDDDIWKAKFYATRDGYISKGQRLCQFRVVKNQKPISVETVRVLGNSSRGGYGSTGGWH